MTDYSSKLYKFYKCIAITLSIALVCSLIPPEGWGLLAGTGVAYAASAANSASSTTGSMGLPSSLSRTESLPGELANLTRMNNANSGQNSKLPTSLANPLSVSRVQSAYRAADAVSGTLIITFTVTNNRPSAITSQLSVSATITDTMAAVAAIDSSSDPHTIHNVILADSLTDHAAFISSSPSTDRHVSQYVWNLGDILPMDSVTATLIVSVPTATANFVDLDTGATAWGTTQGRMVSAKSRPANLAPDTINGEPIGDWLKWTVDADKYDRYMLVKAAELGQDPVRMFEYVRSLGYESYKGSLRGTRGTLWSKAGNSMDQASLLIAMLRASGVPARYLSGPLSTVRSQELILSMFSMPGGTIGSIPPGTAVGDPANDPKLIQETQDHWWVEAYLNGAWVAMDPSFSYAMLGQVFADSTTHVYAEVPDTERHKVTVAVKVEKYHPLNVGNSGLATSYPLSYTFNTVQLVGVPVALGHTVNSNSQGGMVFYYVQHTYVPYLTLGDLESAIEGQPFQEMISNFPFGTFLVTGEWLLFDVRDTDGNVRHYERKVVDKIGFEARQAGGTVSIKSSGTITPTVSELDILSMTFAPGWVPAEVLQSEVYRTAREVAQASSVLMPQVSSLPASPQSPEEKRAQATLISQTKRILMRSLYAHNLLFLMVSDVAQATRDETAWVKSYVDSPRIVAFSAQPQSVDAIEWAFDLCKDDVRILNGPGQSVWGTYTAQIARGYYESTLEGWLLRYAGLHGVSTADVFSAAFEQNISILMLNPNDPNDFERLNQLGVTKSG